MVLPRFDEGSTTPISSELPRGVPGWLSSIGDINAVHDFDRKAAGVATTPARVGASARASKIERDGTLLNGGSIAKPYR